MNDEEKEVRLKYGDILTAKVPTSPKHKRLPMEKRATQFSPFAALNGYEDSLKEEARETEQKAFLNEDQKEAINQKLQDLLTHPKSPQKIRLTYFVKDEKKKGGHYQKKVFTLKKIDTLNKALITKEGESILIQDIYSLEIL